VQESYEGKKLEEMGRAKSWRVTKSVRKRTGRAARQIRGKERALNRHDQSIEKAGASDK